MNRLISSYKFDTLFSEESTKRHFIMLGISVLLAVWTYVVLGMISGWDWVTQIFKSAKNGWEAFAEIGMALGLIAVFSGLIYWCFKLWMVRFLLKAVVGLFGWLPFVRRLDPDFKDTERGMEIQLKKLNKKIRKADKNDPNLPTWRAEADRLSQRLQSEKEYDAYVERETAQEHRREAKAEAREDRKEVFRRMALYPEDDIFTIKGEVEAERGAEKLAGCLMVPVSLIFALLLHLLKIVGYLVGSIGIPVLAPVFILVIASLVNMLCGNNAVIVSIVAIVLMTVGACVLLVHPILAVVRNRGAKY